MQQILTTITAWWLYASDHFSCKWFQSKLLKYIHSDCYGFETEINTWGSMLATPNGKEDRDNEHSFKVDAIEKCVEYGCSSFCSSVKRVCIEMSFCWKWNPLKLLPVVTWQPLHCEALWGGQLNSMCCYSMLTLQNLITQCWCCVLNGAAKMFLMPYFHWLAVSSLQYFPSYVE